MNIADYVAALERGLGQNPEVVTHPHHKHIGPMDRLAPSDPPSLSQVLAEMEGLSGEQGTG